jgi:hypothetical protein
VGAVVRDGRGPSGVLTSERSAGAVVRSVEERHYLAAREVLRAAQDGQLVRLVYDGARLVLRYERHDHDRLVAIPCVNAGGVFNRYLRDLTDVGPVSERQLAAEFKAGDWVSLAVGKQHAEAQVERVNRTKLVLRPLSGGPALSRHPSRCIPLDETQARITAAMRACSPGDHARVELADTQIVTGNVLSTGRSGIGASLIEVEIADEDGPRYRASASAPKRRPSIRGVEITALSVV